MQELLCATWTDIFTKCVHLLKVVDLVSVLRLYEEAVPQSFWELLKSKADRIEARWKLISPSLDKELKRMEFDSRRMEKPGGFSPEEISRAFEEAFLRRIRSNTAEPDSEPLSPPLL